jgi:hypothetical protein
MQPPQRLMACPVRTAHGTQSLDQLGKVRARSLFKHTFFCADTENNFLTGAKRIGLMRQASPREFQPAPPERHLRGGQHGDFSFRQQAEDAMNRLRKAIQHRSFIGTTYQAGRGVAAVPKIDQGQFVVTSNICGGLSIGTSPISP